jgi:hypothetical protein
VLAGGADRDVSEIRAEIRDFREQSTRMLNATRADIADRSGGGVDAGHRAVRTFLESTVPAAVGDGEVRADLDVPAVAPRTAVRGPRLGRPTCLGPRPAGLKARILLPRPLERFGGAAPRGGRGCVTSR